ncbi:hypothetical protein [Thalassomonas actiniarum]|uniref:C-type lectin domain-containing protein n=1 Tax=Thalassomonas actiniarum TaxID=485447 RepID=A0AAE9YZK7_9GAMM|nr:hypothetical protein [Thalassomonas actiniarum]WDE02438.1 hypothetical protein SG35_028925 [Thalassomonas actiniarum]
MNIFRYVIGLTLISLMPSGVAQAESVSEFRNSNDYVRLRAQTSLDENAPFSQATQIQAHNSFNSSAYASGINYIDPNHTLSTTQLLDMGIRSLNFDIHYILNISSPWPWEWQKKLMLCHGQDNHEGCSGGERYLSEGLEELADWLAANPGELVFMYFQDEMEGQYGKAADIIERTVGEYVYHPEGMSCEDGIPVEMSRREILDSGKTLVLNSKCGNAGGWEHLVYNGYKKASGKSGGGTDNNIVLDHNCFGKYDQADFNSRMITVYEDRTTLGQMFTNTPQISAADIEFALSCGVGQIGMDKIHPNDDARIDALLWSWAQGEPNNNGGEQDCLRHNASGRFYDYRCDNNHYAFGCQNAAGNWYVTDSTSVWDDGNAVCTAETNGEYGFAVPVNKYQNERLMAAKLGKSVDNVWLNFTDQGEEGKWVAPMANISINFAEHTLQPYGDQFTSGQVSVEDEGARLRLTGNNWQSIAVDYVITPNTVVELDFSSAVEGELHGFGFDVDNVYGGYKERINFAGTQDAGDVAAYDNYPGDGATKHYVINIGLHDSGYKHRMYFLVDNDETEVGESVFSNVKIYERYDSQVNFADHELLAYAGDEISSGDVSVEDDGATLRMTGSLWRAIKMPRQIADGTVLSFDFASNAQGEIHGIGFDSDLNNSAENRFSLYGSQDTSDISDFASYSGDGVTRYNIPVGRYYTGEMQYLFFVTDDDAAAAGESVFSNLIISEVQVP